MIIIKLYQFVSELQSNTFINIVLSYIITGLIYTVIFYMLCYIKVLSIKSSIFVGITTYIAGLALTISQAVFIKYVIDSKKVAKWEI